MKLRFFSRLKRLLTKSHCYYIDLSVFEGVVMRFEPSIDLPHEDEIEPQIIIDLPVDADSLRG